MGWESSRLNYVISVMLLLFGYPGLPVNSSESFIGNPNLRRTFNVASDHSSRE